MLIGTTIDGKAFSLPAEAVTETFAELAKRGTGKTYLAHVLAEAMMDAGHFIVALDIMGVWWGLRADGKGPGYPVLIIGGEHADIPIDPSGGKFVAQFLVNERVSTVIDLSQLGEAEMRRFAADFLSELYRRNRLPVHLFVEEADEFAPQSNFTSDQAKVLGAMQRVVRRGRSRGIGCTVITQRSAVLNKSVLTQAETLIALRTPAPHDQKPIREWIDVHGTPEEREVVMKSLATLPTGTCWVYSPSLMGCLTQVKVREKRTFDSSATPKPGQAVAKPKSVADVDLNKLSGQMAKSIEQARANDPAELNKRVAELEKQLAAKTRQTPASPTGVDPRHLEQATQKAVRDRDQQWAAMLRTQTDSAMTWMDTLLKGIGDARQWTSGLKTLKPGPALDSQATPAEHRTSSYETHEKQPISAVRIAAANPPHRTTADGGDRLGGCPGAVLRVLAAYPEGRTRRAMALQAQYAVNGSTMRNALSTLRTRGLIEGDAVCLRITDAGRELVGDVEPMPTGRELLAWWANELGGCPGAVLYAISNAGGELSRLEIAGQTGYEATGSTMRNALSKLRTLELISRGDPIQLADVLR